MVRDPVLPDDREYLGREEFQVRIAPRRRAWLVDDGSVEQLSLALQGAASIWGGMRCPVLPVDAEGCVADGWLQAAELLGVTEVVDYTLSASGDSSWTDQARRSWSVRPARPLDDAAFWNIHPIVAHADDDLPGRGLYLPVDSDLLSLAGPGAFGLPDEVQIFRDAGVSVVENCDARTMAKAQLGRTTCLDATQRGDFDSVSISPTLRSIGLIWVASEPNSFDDAVWFWNTRALRPGSTENGVSLLTTPAVLREQQVLDAVTVALDASSATIPTFVVASRSVGDEGLRELAECLGAERHAGDRVSERFAGPPADRRTTFLENVDLREFWSTQRNIGPVRIMDEALRRPAINLTFESPKPWKRQFEGSGTVTLRIASPSITGPSLPNVAKLYLDAATWRDRQLEFNSPNLSTYSFAVRIPTSADILEAACQHSGFSYQVSDKGQQIQGVLEGPGDPTLFRRETFLYVVKALTPRPSKQLVRQLAALPEGVTPEQVEALRVAHIGEHQSSKTMDALRSLVSNNGHDARLVPPIVHELVTRGLVLMGLQIECALCSLKDFQRLTEISAGAICAGCGSRAAFATDAQGSPALQYRLSSLANRLSLNGGLAPLAATTLLSAERAFVLPGANLFKAGVPAGEVDLLGWKGSSLFAGEAKSSAQGFDLSDVDADVKKSAELGADVHVAVCSEVISDEARSRLETACNRHSIELRALDGEQLLLNSA